MLKLALLTDFDGWHEAQLQAVLTRRGVQAVPLSLSDCVLSSSRDPDPTTALQLPGFPQTLPDAVLVRFIPGGSFEQVTRRLSVLHALSSLDVPVFNNARAIERSVDKAMSSFLLSQAGLATPPSWTLESSAEAAVLLRRELAAGHRLVLKPLFGARGIGLQLLQAESDLPPAEQVNGVYYLQRFVAPSDGYSSDYRVLVVGGRALAAMRRRAEHWITNRAQGGECLPAVLTPALAQLAERASRVIGTDYAGVDMIADSDGCLQVLEVNGVPAWRGLQSVNPDIDIAQQLVDALLQHIRT